MLGSGKGLGELECFGIISIPKLRFQSVSPFII